LLSEAGLGAAAWARIVEGFGAGWYEKEISSQEV